MTPQQKLDDLEGVKASSFKEAIMLWLAKQGVIVVLIFVLLGMVAWTGRYAVVEGIPKVVDQINSGYEKMESSHRKEREQSDKLITATMEKVESAVREQSKASQELSRQIENMK